MSAKPLILLGATGSIGVSTVDLVRRYADRFEIVGMSVNRRTDELALLAKEFDQATLHVATEDRRKNFVDAHGDLSGRLTAPGSQGILEMLERHPNAMVVNALVGAAGLQPTAWALDRGMDVALANKEALVVGGQLVLDAARKSGAKLWPVDSEHSAIAQCLRGNPSSELSRIWLTASGGPFRDRDPKTYDSVTLEEVLAHPTWDMGPKITVDSATMMNKGLEVIEAHLLFDVPLDRIEVVVHRESIVHSFVEMVDGVFLAQLGAPDMRLPILFALTEGEHVGCDVAPWTPLSAPELHFEAPDPDRFPCLGIVRKAGELGGAAPIVLNAANEVAVAGLLNGALSFVEIPRILEAALEQLPLTAVSSVEEALDRDQEARHKAEAWVAQRSRS